jgi:protein phosphatase
VADAPRAAVDYANEVVLDNVPRGGTTLVAALVMRDVAYVVNVGDSRAYRITKDEIYQITRDHSQAWEDLQKELVKFFPAENPT